MNTRHAIFALIVSATSCLGGVAIAQDKDVDQADSLDFQSFHKDKKEAIKVWDKTNNTTTKAYQDQPAGTTAPAATTAPLTSTAVPATNSTPAAKTADTSGSAGKRFEIRERYTLTRSVKTPYSAFYVIEPLFKQSAQLCAKGWKKLNERSEPIEQDYYLYYEIECL